MKVVEKMVAIYKTRDLENESSERNSPPQAKKKKKKKNQERLGKVF